MQEVRLSDNPITDTGVAARFMIVARIGKLTSLNGSQVLPLWSPLFNESLDVTDFLLVTLLTNSCYL